MCLILHAAALLALSGARVTGTAEGTPIGFIPEQGAIAFVWGDVVHFL